LSFTEYADAPENRSWQKNQTDVWEWNLPTPGGVNTVPEIPRIIFSEILPVPETDQDEFVEFYNLATTTINLKDFSLNIGTRSKTFSEADKILPGSYLTLFADELPVALRNSGQSISLKDSWGREVAAIKYAQAQKSFSYASLDGKEFMWTATVTPGAANQMVLGGSTQSVPTVKTATASPAVKQSTKSAKQPSDEFLLALLQQNKEQTIKLAALQEAVDNLSQEIEGIPLKEAADTPAAPEAFGSRYLVLASVCGILLFGLFKFLPKNPSPGKPV
ncbi:MAG: lamin tail domain-containing protein, partial [Patescibacteria group bacterium]|nr:lamin tail domain-containing protein [Patescibacteria group bacterium]